MVNSMSYRDMEINISYVSCTEEGIAKALIVPALKCTKLYKRSVGYFSSGVIETIIDGIPSFARNGGKIKLIASPFLSCEDIDAINLGYEGRESRINGVFSDNFIKELEKLDDEKLELLAELIAKDILDIRIAVTNTLGFYHDKFGVMEDFDNNIFVFYGSSNSSLNGYRDNYDKIRIAKSWIDGQKENVDDEILEFDNLWNNNNEFVKVYEYKESAKNNIFKVIKNRKNSKKNEGDGNLRDYQKAAIKKWVDNNYRGFYIMATGTGKTRTAIYSAVELLKKNKATIIICAPYKHLVKQWAEDVVDVFKKAVVILVSSENSLWEKQINEAIIKKKYDNNTQIIIITTISSFGLQRFEKTIDKDDGDKLLIVDEAHRFKATNDDNQKKYKYMLGLSATPYGGSSAASGKKLMNWFGGEVYNLPIEEALKKGFLVNYNYYPIFVKATDEEERRFAVQTSRIPQCFKNGVCIDAEELAKILRNRLRIISMAQAKIDGIRDIIATVKDIDHIVVYCGDGRLFDDAGVEIRHIRMVKRVLNEMGYRSSQFTARENMFERMDLVDAFNKGEITALAAIRCLDEGINIPSIKSALILSSNDNYREFVQRRGRILRLYEGKDKASIYDVIVLPSEDKIEWAKIELRRYLEYAKLALNVDELNLKLKELLMRYGLDIEDIDVYDYEGMEVDIDE